MNKMNKINKIILIILFNYLFKIRHNYCADSVQISTYAYGRILIQD